MAKLTVKQVLQAATEEIERHPEGMRFGEIYKWFQKNHPEVAEGTLAGNLAQVPVHYPDRITKPARGLYVPLKSNGANTGTPMAQVPAAIKEADLYKPFAAFLLNELDEATKVVELGGACMKTKWGTPDVLGVFRPQASDLIKFLPEIVSCEIKCVTDQSIVAFGQAISYRLFPTNPTSSCPPRQTHKSSLVSKRCASSLVSAWSCTGCWRVNRNSRSGLALSGLSRIASL